MLRTIVWWQAIVFFILGGLLGQRFAHIHPIGSVRNSTTSAAG